MIVTISAPAVGMTFLLPWTLSTTPDPGWTFTLQVSASRVEGSAVPAPSKVSPEVTGLEQM